MKMIANDDEPGACVSTFNAGEKVTMEYTGNEFTTTIYLIEATNSGKTMIRLLSEDTCVFVLLVRWVYQEEMECKMQKERRDMPMQGKSKSDMTSFPYPKAKR